MGTPRTQFTFCPQCRAQLQRRIIDGVDRTACSTSCGYVHWENPTPVVAGLVQHGENFLLARNATWPTGLFSLITGFLEKGESPEQAIARETNEELGVNADAILFLGHFPLPDLNQLIIGYTVGVSGEIRLGAEIAEVLSLSKAEIQRHDFGKLELTAKIVAAMLSLTNYSTGPADREFKR